MILTRLCRTRQVKSHLRGLEQVVQRVHLQAHLQCQASWTSTALTCIVERCEDPRKRNSRFCVHHGRLYDNMRYQAQKQGATTLEIFLKKMKNNEVASSELVLFASQNLSTAGARNKSGTVNWMSMGKGNLSSNRGSLQVSEILTDFSDVVRAETMQTLNFKGLSERERL